MANSGLTDTDTIHDVAANEEVVKEPLSYEKQFGNQVIASNSGVHLYPNPACDWLTVTYDFEGERVRLLVQDVHGREWENVVLDSSQGLYRLDLSSFASGVYFLSILDRSGGVISERFVKH